MHTHHKKEIGRFRASQNRVQVLTPVQAAVLHVQAGRDPLEPLSFCNHVAAEYGAPAASTPEAAALDAGPAQVPSPMSPQLRAASHEAKALVRQHVHKSIALPDDAVP